MFKFRINDYIELRFEDGKTNIYVDNELFIQCKYLLLNFSTNNFEDYEDINSIDEAIETLDKSFEFFNTERNSISPEDQFWGHCSNLQAWYKNLYNSSLIHSNLAFPLLRKLAEAGDFLAIKVFKEEIAKKFESGYIPTVTFLLYNGYLNCLDEEELNYVFAQSASKLIQNIIQELSRFMVLYFDNYKRIKELIDLVLFIDLKFNQNFLIDVVKHIPQESRVAFTKFAILHMNYKEFEGYKIPYGKFYIYFEQMIDFLYETYAHFGDMLKLLDSGFHNSPLSLDEKLSYGSVSYE